MYSLCIPVYASGVLSHAELSNSVQFSTRHGVAVYFAKRSNIVCACMYALNDKDIYRILKFTVSKLQDNLCSYMRLLEPSLLLVYK